ncbi:hypothetical protein CGRA01v4_00647 [Colletotrichum graminicola]|nr:hypothetical protein CGRA01v4_00647 [Colletotrichum graminicola]
MPCVSPSVWALSYPPPVCRAVLSSVWSSPVCVNAPPDAPSSILCRADTNCPLSDSVNVLPTSLPTQCFTIHYLFLCWPPSPLLLQPRPYPTAVPTSQAFQLTAKPQE